MSTIDIVSFLVALLFFIAGAWFLRRYLGSPAPRSKAPKGKQVSFECTVCHHKDILYPKALLELPAPEMALAVRSYPSYASKRFVEHVCTGCQTPHWFLRKGSKLQWVGIDKDAAHTSTGACTDCGTRFQSPPWPRGQYDHRVLSAPAPQPDLGLICPRCHTHVCLECTKTFSKHHAPKGELWCPRCGRPPMDTFWHAA